MASYTHNGLGGSPATPWYNVNIDGDSPITSTSTLFVLPNSDGTFTLIHGNGFTYLAGEPTGGTVTSIDRANDAAGTTVYETVTGLNLSLVALTSTDGEGNREAFALIFAGADTFNGHGGNDLFVGGPGSDNFLGGTGSDTVSYDNALASVSANLLNAAGNTGDAAGDNYNNSIENLIGSDFDDSLFGNGVDNIISAGLGNDSLAGGATMGGLSGNDTLDGGAGSDIGNYTSTNITASITAVLSTTSTVTGNATVGTDTLISVERIRGTQFNDSFTATINFSGSNGTGAEFEGNDGDDTIIGNGTTRVGYSQAAAGVTVNLLAGTAQSIAVGDLAQVGVDSFAGTIGPNSINAVNSVRGSAFDDVISAAGARGQFDFIGGTGNDTFIGTTEAINNFDNNEARYDVGTGTPNAISVVLDTVSTVNGGAAFGTDTLINVERVRGTALNDTFTANAGFSAQYGTQNWFEGMGGNDAITGNGHTFILYSNALAAVTVNLQSGIAQSTAGGDTAGIGTDTIIAGVNQVTGSNFNDMLIGSNGAQAESLNGDEGNDTINGGGGALDRAGYRNNPSGIVANLTTGLATDGWGDTDTLIDIEGVGGSEFNDVITGDGNSNRLGGQNGDDQLFGLAGDDFLDGDDGAELYAGAFGNGGVDFDSGNDLLDGGTGADQMWGGKGNDTYVVDNVGDVVTENASEGTDLVQTGLANYSLKANFENLTGTLGAGQSLAGNGLNNVITGVGGNDIIEGLGGSDTLNGQGGDDVLIGSDGSDTINGGTGVDALIGLIGTNTMTGGAGDDVYYSYSATDVMVELAGAAEGNDVVVSDHSIVLSANVERVILLNGATSATGNGSDNLIFGLEVTNAGLTLDGGAGNDILYGSEQSDTLLGGSEMDTLLGFGGTNNMTGGAGDDTYFSYSAADTINENAGAGEGVDQVISTHDITLSANVENLTLRGLAATGIGNGSDNQLFGLESSNGLILQGLGGADVLIGSNQADLLEGGTGNDFLFGAGGADAFQFKSPGFGNDTVTDFVTTVADGVNHDYVDLRGLGQSFGSLNIAYGTGATITIGADTIFLTGVTSGLQNSDFLF